MSPGGLEAATQDFTSDKARLLAAIDRFTGNKIRSASVELAEERRLAPDLHGGKDPSDHELAGRAEALTNVLQAVFAIDPIECIGGSLPRTQQRLVEAWAEIHREELLRDWELLQAGQPPFKIEPLR